MPGMATTMKEFGAGKLRSGSKTGPVVKSPKQAAAIALSQTKKPTKPAPSVRPRPVDDDNDPMALRAKRVSAFESEHGADEI